MKGRKTRTHKPLAKRVAKIERELNKKDIKYTLQSFIAGSTILPNYDAVQVQLGAIPPQGDGAQERVGDEYQPTKMEVGLSWSAASTTSAFCRLIIVQYKHDVASTTTADTLEGLGQATAPHCTFTIQERDDYVVLYDKRFNIVNLGTTAYTTKMLHFDLYPKIPIRLDSNSTNVNSGQIMGYFISDYANGSANRPEVTGFVKMRFTDC